MQTLAYVMCTCFVWQLGSAAYMDSNIWLDSNVIFLFQINFLTEKSTIHDFDKKNAHKNAVVRCSDYGYCIGMVSVAAVWIYHLDR